jgi:RNAse (barnase) inhibitor barstar
MCSLFGFRLEYRNLTDDELDRLVKQTFRIDQATLREIDALSDLFSQVESDPQLIE